MEGRAKLMSEEEILSEYFPEPGPEHRALLDRIRDRGKAVEKRLKTKVEDSDAMLGIVDELVALGTPRIAALRFCFVQPRPPLLGAVLGDERLSSDERILILEHFVRHEPDEYPVLDLSRQGLTRVPAEVDQIEMPTVTVTEKELPYREISLGYNQLEALSDDDFRRLNHFQGLHFMGTKLQTIPGGVRFLKNAIMLNFSWTDIAELPPEIVQLTELRALKLNWTKLGMLPENIAELRELAFIELTETLFLHRLYQIDDNNGVAETDEQKQAAAIRDSLVAIGCEIDE